ncbi:VPLPA-CTERM sorting domain-containing protein [Methylomonas koyamae]|uniref:VPLPA-CTERM sorting domain-containing protein n=1 Tax=Methylomonas koyamae TaxID=702114 RepID=UPI001C821A43|nr:VPLPA-CTERM sorting domain-containing protein [Methylomonas koyamae]
MGYSATAGNAAYHALLYSNGAMQDLGTLGGSYTRPAGINASGQVVGYAYTAGDATHAFLYSNGAMQDLGTLGGTYSAASGINASGQVVGNAYTAGDAAASHAFLYSNGVMTDLNTLIAANSGWTLQLAAAINDQGQIVGSGINAQSKIHAFLLTANTAPVPVPAAVWLFGSALAGFGLFGRRKAA